MIKNMLLRSLLILILSFSFVSGGVLANTNTAPKFSCEVGFVEANCDNEKNRINNYKKSIGIAEDDICDSVHPGCDALLKDLNQCREQCVPKVTNGGILAGPKSGSTARDYLLGKFLPNLTNSFLIFYMIVGVIFIIIAGFMWILAPVNEEMKAKARDTLIWGIIGLSLGVVAYVLVQIVININFFV